MDGLVDNGTTWGCDGVVVAKFCLVGCEVLGGIDKYLGEGGRVGLSRCLGEGGGGYTRGEVLPFPLESRYFIEAVVLLL